MIVPYEQLQVPMKHCLLW